MLKPEGFLCALQLLIRATEQFLRRLPCNAQLLTDLSEAHVVHDMVLIYLPLILIQQPAIQLEKVAAHYKFIHNHPQTFASIAHKNMLSTIFVDSMFLY